MSKNGISAALGFAVSSLTMLILYKFLVSSIGLEKLGIWSLVVAMTSLAGIGSSGFAGSIVKFIAKFNELNQRQMSAYVVETSFLTILGILIVLTTSIYLIYSCLSEQIFSSLEADMIRTLLPFVLSSFIVANLAYVFQATLDGLQLFYIKNVNLIISRFVYLVSAFLFVSSFNMVGLAYAYLLQYIVLFVLSYLAVMYKLSEVSFLIRKFNKGLFKDIAIYGYKFQLATMANLCIDPMVKLLLKNYADLTAVGLFEMISKLMEQIKGILAQVLNIYVPIFAVLVERKKSEVDRLFIELTKISLCLGVGVFPMVIVMLPVISILWIGELSSSFILYGILIAIYLSVSLLATPAWFRNLGTGELFVNFLTYVIFAVLNFAGGVLLFPIFGVIGVVVAYSSSGVLACTYLLLAKSNYPINKLFAKVLDRIDIILIGLWIMAITSIKYILNIQDYSRISFVVAIVLLIMALIYVYYLRLKDFGDRIKNVTQY